MLVEMRHDSVGGGTPPSITGTPQQPKTGWLGIPTPSRPQILLRSKGEQYLVRVIKTDEGEFFLPTGEAEGDLIGTLADKQGFTIVTGPHRLRIPAQAVEQKWYRYDNGVHHLAISASNTSELIAIVSSSRGMLRWMKAVDLYTMAQQRRLSPVLLQAMCIEMMAGAGA